MATGKKGVYLCYKAVIAESIVGACIACIARVACVGLYLLVLAYIGLYLFAFACIGLYLLGFGLYWLVLDAFPCNCRPPTKKLGSLNKK